MRYASLCVTLLALALASTAAAQTVTLTLDSTQDGQVVAGGATIEWSIIFSVSPGDNEGLALLAVDLQQGAGNPAFLDIPPANGVPAEMANFSRPDGVSNPGETDPTTGYIGVQRGDAGAMNLVQIGGGQNNFGEAMPEGSGIAENANVIGGVGQDTPGVLAAGSFDAPTACGTYTLNDPPAHSTVIEATTDLTAGSISVIVTLPGDLDLDGDVDLSDLAQLLGNYGETGMTYTDGDIDGDGDVDLSDLAALLGNYGDSC